MPGYYKGQWKEYAIHDENNIKGFFGDYRFLSNFWPSKVWFEGLSYNYLENAYQAAKIMPEYRFDFMDCSPTESKSLWKTLPKLDATPEQWDKRKYDVMSVLVVEKFYRNLDLRQKLLETGNRYLEERNNWKDCFFGYDINLGGQNELGKILMKVREFWK